MKGRWAEGISPRNFSWVIRDALAISERPGGYSRSHRPVRRTEEIIWIREQGFSRVVSLLSSPHNLHAYAELGVAAEHLPLIADDPAPSLAGLYRRIGRWQAAREKVLVHHEELGDLIQGTVAGYLLWAGLVPQPAQAIAVIETINHRPMGTPGRALVAIAATLDGRVDPNAGLGATGG
ncbi:MAG: hypothetical protein ACT4OS_06650 [Acidimicrobiales bacterium]